LVRELQEEVGITPLGATLFDKLEYQFPDRHITLWFPDSIFPPGNSHLFAIWASAARWVMKI
jgi:8-oxo-dGTP pyrophosphatase MutT (NUDIX family)